MFYFILDFQKNQILNEDSSPILFQKKIQQINPKNSQIKEQKILKIILRNRKKL